jgi:hypothetical protein
VLPGDGINLGRHVARGEKGGEAGHGAGVDGDRARGAILGPESPLEALIEGHYVPGRGCKSSLHGVRLSSIGALCKNCSEQKCR